LQPGIASRRCITLRRWSALRTARPSSIRSGFRRWTPAPPDLDTFSFVFIVILLFCSTRRLYGAVGALRLEKESLKGVEEKATKTRRENYFVFPGRARRRQLRSSARWISPTTARTS